MHPPVGSKKKNHMFMIREPVWITFMESTDKNWGVAQATVSN